MDAVRCTRWSDLGDGWPFPDVESRLLSNASIRTVDSRPLHAPGTTPDAARSAIQWATRAPHPSESADMNSGQYISGLDDFHRRRPWIGAAIVFATALFANVGCLKRAERPRRNTEAAEPGGGGEKDPQKAAAEPETTAVGPFDVGTHAGEERADNRLKLKLCWCPPGDFKMGEASASQVDVKLTRGSARGHQSGAGGGSRGTLPYRAFEPRRVL